MATVTYDDVAVALGRPITDSDEIAQVNWWITSAETQIKARLGDLTLLDQDVLNYVLVEAVTAKAQNPTGASSEQIDDYRYTLPTESRRVTILDEWWHMLRPNVGFGVFSARPSFEADTVSPFEPSWDSP